MKEIVKISDVINVLEKFAPSAFQESYDNAGLIVGEANWEISGVLTTLDCVEEVVEEAIAKNANLIIAHHPIVFNGLKRFNGSNYIERTIIKAIKHDIAIYASHTNLDSVQGGVNSVICGKIGLQNCQVLSPVAKKLVKLVVFVPTQHAQSVRNAIFKAGAGVIGDYDCCSFNINGTGSFRASDKAIPFVGEKEELHYEQEVRVETILPQYLKSKVVSSMIAAHPYEEVAYDVYPLENNFDRVGIGMVGELANEMDEKEFLEHLKTVFDLKILKHTKLLGKKVKKVAVCGGSGSFLLAKAIAKGADVFVSGDFKYHQYFDAENKIVIADVGHFETEQFTKEIFYRLITEKFSTFVVYQSEVNTNPTFYV